MKRLHLILVALLVCMTAVAKDAYDTTKWEKDISKFEKQDQENNIKNVDVLFLGSSSIRMWKIKKWFPELNAINRGFGGSQIEDSIYYFDRLVTPYQPKVIVFYAGDNDVGSGKSPQRVFNDFKTFIHLMKTKAPGSRLIYVAIKPSIKRWNLIDEVRETNKMIHQYCVKKSNLEFFNIDPPMIGPDGHPRKEIFLEDGLHLNEDGYQLWSSMLYPKIERMLKKG
ncbi:MAG: SGNH/GDSL hydrolase family protein [Candidatus Hinthialibacter antarcticus]|nr:SGNH/GDSL hydrolase family protein [Candidatus Hinthialibacter antarcticus]